MRNKAPSRATYFIDFSFMTGKHLIQNQHLPNRDFFKASLKRTRPDGTKYSKIDQLKLVEHSL